MEIWTEVAGRDLVLTWFWDPERYDLGVVVSPIGNATVTGDVMHEIERYSDDKELNLMMGALYDEHDFDGSLEEFTQAYAEGAV